MHTYLALGDSYTIGEMVPLHASFPYQAVQLLRKNGIEICPPEIVAKTGWTTGELLQHIDHTALLETYSMVTLLIGVNNQYRGFAVADFLPEFEKLLSLAIKFAGANPQKVVVLSIPDWGVTPYAKDRDAKQIASEIDAFNSICQQQALSWQCNYIDITAEQRKNGMLPEFLAADGLHPSSQEYAVWAQHLVDVVLNKSVLSYNKIIP